MNLFHLHINIKKSVKYHTDEHVIKIILECTQLLYNVWCTLSEDDYWRVNAPNCGYLPIRGGSVELREWPCLSIENYNWLISYAKELCKEYTFRYKKIHSCEKHIQWLSENIPPIIGSLGFTIPPQVMDEEFKSKRNNPSYEKVVHAYRRYYRYKSKTLKKFSYNYTKNQNG